MRTQILVHRWGPRTRIQHYFADGLNQSLVSTVEQANLTTTVVQSSANSLSTATQKYFHIILILFTLTLTNTSGSLQYYGKQEQQTRVITFWKI